MSANRVGPGRRHRLLLYDRMYASRRWPLLLIALGTAVLWWRAPGVSFLAPHEDWLLGIGGLSLFIFADTFVARYFCFVQCHPRHLRIQTPLYRVVVSYQRVHHVRPIALRDMYPPSRQRWNERYLLEPLAGMTCVGVNLNSYPLGESWLRLWLNRLMFTRDTPGFLFLVADWMTLSREIDVYRDRWNTARARAARPARISQNPFSKR